MILARILPMNISPFDQYKLKLYYNESNFMYSLKRYHRTLIKLFRFKNIGPYDYQFKWTDRRMINELANSSKEDQETIFLNEGYLTDSSLANIILSDGRLWWTPEKPLLCGTMRAVLLKENKIQCKSIHYSELSSYESFKLINALNSFDEAFHYPISLLNEINF